jgi:pSer/pThr/pTyr-binding forkhead associated (FHA) protein
MMADQFQLVMRSGPTPGAVYPLEGDQIMVGRDSANGVAINDAEVSRRHARLTFQGGKYVIEDVGSTNGTFVNGQRLAGPYVLKPGDVVSFGEQIVLMYDAANVDPGATLASPKKSRAAAPPAPSAPPPPPQSYAGQVASGPAQPAARGTNMLPIVVAIGVLAFVCVCGVALWYIDSNFLWCTVMPFLGGC